MAGLLLAVIYLAFISLGLPDSILGAAWPSMSRGLGVPFSWAGGISMVISTGTVISALLSERVTRRLGVGRVTACSVGLTALSLLGFSLAPSYWVLLALALPYGLGAGGVDAALNNYVAVHYASRHMSWLHCMWGVGAAIGPYVMGFALSRGQGWPWGYRYIAMAQVVLTLVIVASLPLWQGEGGGAGRRRSRGSVPPPDQPRQDSGEDRGPIPLWEVVCIPGVADVMLAFFCYCGIETTVGLWASTYMTLEGGLNRVAAARWASLFYLGITAGRALGGFLTMKFNDPVMVRSGQAILLAGILCVFLPSPGQWTRLVGLILVGLGAAPIYPCMIHATPAHFGVRRSQAVIGVQMASANAGSLLAPPVFGLMAGHFSIALLPAYLLFLLAGMVLGHERLEARSAV